MTLLAFQPKVAIGNIIGPDGRPVPVYGSNEFLRYINIDLYNRVGGADGLTNAQLEALATSFRLGVFEKPSKRDKTVKAGQFVTVTQDAGGYTVSVDSAGLFASILPFLPRSQQIKQRPNDAQAIIAGRVFGAH